jgi:hypothetical protein
MTKRLAITIAGAVSLGSYEAGVLFELMRAIRTNNEAARSEDTKICGQSTEKQWKQVCTAAVGSGAFPAAFRPEAVEHSVEEFGERLPAEQSLWIQGKIYVDWIGQSPAEFAHSDGGVLQNQPSPPPGPVLDATPTTRSQSFPRPAANPLLR